MSSEKALSKEWATPVNRVEAYHRTLIAYKNMAQSVLHAGDTAEADVNLAWEILEDVMQGLIDVFIDWFPDEETDKKQDVTWADLVETRRELGMVQERNMKNFVSFDDDHRRILALEQQTETLFNRLDVLERKDVVSWRDFRDFLDDNAEDFESVSRRLNSLERWRAKEQGDEIR